MQTPHRLVRRKHTNHGNALNLPPVVTSILSQVVGGGNQPTVAPANPSPQTQTGGGSSASTPPSAPQTTTVGSAVPPGNNPPPPGGSGGGNSEIGVASPGSPNSLSPSDTLSANAPGNSGLASGGATFATSPSQAAGGGSDQSSGNAGANPNYSGGSHGSPTSNSYPGDPNSTGSDGDSSDSGSTGNSDSGTGSHNQHLSPGAVFALSFLFLVFIVAVIILVLRRRNNIRRNERRLRLFGVNRLLGFGVSSGSDNATIGSGTRSARSSFATNIDHGLTPLPSATDFGTIALPPMAELRPNTNHVEVPTDMLVNVDTGSNRSSVSSTYSGTQYLLIPGSNSQNFEPPVPMLVSPFTPSESFAFPKPPPTTAEKEASIAEDAHAGNLWLSKPSSPPPTIEVPAPAVLAGSPLPLVPPSPVHVPPRVSTADPFADPRENYDGYPNDDPPKPETVRRHFAPTLGDELAVEPGDQVVVRKVYDDGWAYVEKNDGKGLVPFDCLREVDQDIPAFLAAKRVSSSYGGIIAM